MPSTRPISVLYLGKRGGGARFTYELVQEFRINYGVYPIVVIRKDNPYAEMLKREGYRTVLISLKTLTFLPFLRFFNYGNVRLILKSIPQDSIVLVAMHHPIQNYINKVMKKNNFQIINILHDFFRHPGDFWPSNFFLQRYIQSGNSVITLSNYVQKQISPKISSKVASFPEPYLSFKFLPSQRDIDILVIGRFKKYKNLKSLQRLTSIENLNYKIVIAGSGKLPRGVATSPSLIIKNRWLTEKEICELIHSSKALVLPYSEASQSGWIGLALSLGTPVFSTSVGGLAEQFESGVGGLSFGSSEELFTFISQKATFLAALDHLNPKFHRTYPRISDLILGEK